MNNYNNPEDALSDLRKRGYTETFEIETFCLYCGDLDLRLDPADFNVDERYRFDGSSKESGSMLIAITALNGVKGILIDSTNSAASVRSE